MAEVRIKGLNTLQTYLDKLPAKMEANILRGALRAGMNVVKPVAQQKIRSRTGLLAAGLKVGTRIRHRRYVQGNLKATGEHAFIAPWLEFGTRAHTISAKAGGALATGRFFAKSVEHPGIARGPHAFMRPALDQMAGRAVVAAGEFIKRRLEKKHGLDLRHIRVEGDE